MFQQYGEVVCCIGNSLAFPNHALFTQADIAIAAEPLVKRCLNKTDGAEQKV